jgi:hypothetical protein
MHTTAVERTIPQVCCERRGVSLLSFRIMMAGYCSSLSFWRHHLTSFLAQLLEIAMPALS